MWQLSIFLMYFCFFFFFSSRRRHTRLQGDWSSDVCATDDVAHGLEQLRYGQGRGPIVRQLVAAAGQLDRVARERAEAERRTVDQPELPLLALVHPALALPHQGPGEEQDQPQREARARPPGTSGRPGAAVRAGWVAAAPGKGRPPGLSRVLGSWSA